MKNLRQDIRRMTNALIKRVKQSGIYENFGQTEVSKLKDKHIDSSLYDDEMNSMRDMIDNFNEWCMTYTGRK